MKKNKIKFILSAILLITTEVLIFLAKRRTMWFFSFYPKISKALVSTLSNITSFVSFDIWEIIAGILIIWCVFNLIYSLRNKNLLKWLSESLLCLSIIVFMFVGLWGLNYYAPEMKYRLGYVDTQYTTEQLAEVTEYFCLKANEYAEKVERDENYIVKTDFALMSKQAGENYKKLSEENEIFKGSFAPVKKLLTGKIFSMRGTTGIFICITGESNVSEYVFPRELPFVMCHEIGHRMAFARENEANFAGFLACDASDNVAFKYAGYYVAFINCYNALYKVNKELARQVREKTSIYLEYDMYMSHQHYDNIEIQKAVEVSDGIYEQYLQAFDVTSGMQSYGEVVDLLAMWYFQQVK